MLIVFFIFYSISCATEPCAFGCGLEPEIVGEEFDWKNIKPSKLRTTLVGAIKTMQLTEPIAALAVIVTDTRQTSIS